MGTLEGNNLFKQVGHLELCNMISNTLSCALVPTESITIFIHCRGLMRVHHPPTIPHLFPFWNGKIFLQIQLLLVHSVSSYPYISLLNMVILNIYHRKLLFLSYFCLLSKWVFWPVIAATIAIWLTMSTPLTNNKASAGGLGKEIKRWKETRGKDGLSVPSTVFLCSVVLQDSSL